MNIKNKALSVLAAALFAVSSLFSGSALAEHCDHGPVPIDDEVFEGYDG